TLSRSMRNSQSASRNRIRRCAWIGPDARQEPSCTLDPPHPCAGARVGARVPWTAPALLHGQAGGRREVGGGYWNFEPERPQPLYPSRFRECLPYVRVAGGSLPVAERESGACTSPL